MKKLTLMALFLLFTQGAYAETVKDKSTELTAIASDKNYEQIVLAGGHPFGVRFSVAGSICNFVNTDKQSCLVRPVRNSGEAISLLQSGKVDFSLVQSDWYLHAREGTSRFSGMDKADNLLIVASFPAESAVLIVSKDSDIETVKDLKNSNIDIGKSGTYRNVVSNVVLDSVGLDLGDVKVSNREQDESIEALCKGKIDATLFMLGNPNPILDTMTAQCNIKIIGFSDNQISFIGKNLKGFYPMEIPAETYWGQESPIRTIGLYTMLITNKDSDKNIVERMHKILSDNIEKISVMHPILNTMSKDNLSKIIQD